MKIRSEINEKDMKEKITNINKTKSLSFEKINKLEKPSHLTPKGTRERTTNKTQS